MKAGLDQGFWSRDSLVPPCGCRGCEVVLVIWGLHGCGLGRMFEMQRSNSRTG